MKYPKRRHQKRIYVVLPATVEVPGDASVPPISTYIEGGRQVKYVPQPAGRQIAQACHVVSKLRFLDSENKVEPTTFQPITTIILAARDSKEMMHAYEALLRRRLKTVLFSDENVEAYGDFKPITALAVLAAPSKVRGILDYLPLWGK